LEPGEGGERKSGFNQVLYCPRRKGMKEKQKRKRAKVPDTEVVARKKRAGRSVLWTERVKVILVEEQLRKVSVIVG